MSKPLHGTASCQLTQSNKFPLYLNNLKVLFFLLLAAKSIFILNSTLFIIAPSASCPEHLTLSHG